MIDRRWDKLSDEEWDAFASIWCAELRGDEPDTPLPDLPWLLDDPPSKAIDYVVPMNFSGSPEAQWKFILAAYWHGDETTHQHLAAGPVEHLLSKFGDEYITLVEQLAEDDPLFAMLLRGCYQHLMSDDVWNRLCIARGTAE